MAVIKRIKELLPSDCVAQRLRERLLVVMTIQGASAAYIAIVVVIVVARNKEHTGIFWLAIAVLMLVIVWAAFHAIRSWRTLRRRP